MRLRPQQLLNSLAYKLMKKQQLTNTSTHQPTNSKTYIPTDTQTPKIHQIINQQTQKFIPPPDTQTPKIHQIINLQTQKLIVTQNWIWKATNAA